jgi:hypothetical protein
MLRGIGAIMIGVSVSGQFRGARGQSSQLVNLSNKSLDRDRRVLEDETVLQFSTVPVLSTTAVPAADELGWETILSYGGAAAGGVAFVVTVGRWVKGKIDAKKKAELAAAAMKAREQEVRETNTKAYEEANRQEVETVLHKNKAGLELSMGPVIQLVVTKESLEELLAKARQQAEESKDTESGNAEFIRDKRQLEI